MVHFKKHEKRNKKQKKEDEDSASALQTERGSSDWTTDWGKKNR